MLFSPYFILKEYIFSLFFLSNLLKKKWKIKKEKKIRSMFLSLISLPPTQIYLFLMTTNLLFDSFVWLASRLIIRFPPWFFFKTRGDYLFRMQDYHGDSLTREFAFLLTNQRCNLHAVFRKKVLPPDNFCWICHISPLEIFASDRVSPLRVYFISGQEMHQPKIY